MKIQSALLAALCLLPANAFVSNLAPKASPLVLNAEYRENFEEGMFPEIMPLKTIQGGGTLLTYKLPQGYDRCQYVVRTNGRPLKGKIDLWLGPLRRTHGVDINIEDGDLTPFRATLKYKPGPAPVLKFQTTSSYEFPMEVSVVPVDPERGAELAAHTENMFDTCDKTLVQGGSISGGGGAIRTFSIPTEVESVQLLIWSKNTGKKSCKAMIEVWQGPDKKKQTFDLHLGGGSQPYHAILETPGPGVTVRLMNKKFIEDGLFQCAVLPYKVGEAVDTSYAMPSGNWWE